jgi:nucleoid-associated protein YgaU
MVGFFIKLSFNNETEKFLLPVNPESIEIKESGKGKTYDIVGTGEGAGEINVIKNRQLTEISFTSMFPASWYPFVIVQQKDLLTPEAYTNYIKTWLKAKHPIRFQSVGTSVAINLPMSIEKFDWKEMAGSPGDIEYSLTLKEYVFYSAKKPEKQLQANGETVLIEPSTPRQDDRVRPETYTLVSGDSLSLIASRLLDDESRWREIQSLNGIPTANLKRLPIGMVVKIPQN